MHVKTNLDLPIYLAISATATTVPVVSDSEASLQGSA